MIKSTKMSKLKNTGKNKCRPGRRTTGPSRESKGAAPAHLGVSKQGTAGEVSTSVTHRASRGRAHVPIGSSLGETLRPLPQRGDSQKRHAEGEKPEERRRVSLHPRQAEASWCSVQGVSGGRPCSVSSCSSCSWIQFVNIQQTGSL